jgi:hypothetical protein
LEPAKVNSPLNEKFTSLAVDAALPLNTASAFSTPRRLSAATMFTGLPMNFTDERLYHSARMLQYIWRLLIQVSQDW